METPDTVTISVERLRELEQAENELIIATEKMKKANHSDIKRLRAYDKSHPEKPRERYNRFISTHREAYNARRRELYKLKKDAKTDSAPVG